MLTSLILAALAVVAVPTAQSTAAASGATEIVIATPDKRDRLTIPVRIGARGPYRFLVDTGAERTVVSRRIAAELALPVKGHALVLGVAGSRTVDLVEVESLSFGRSHLFGIIAPLLDSANMGADGIVGLDSLQDRRILFDFEKDLLVVDAGRHSREDRGFEIVVRARRRSGQLILTEGQVDGVRTHVVIDTGSEGSIANGALQRRLSRRPIVATTALQSVTGQLLTADVAMVGMMKLGQLSLGNFPLAFAESPTFKALRLDKRPALLLGMNELRAFRRVAIDFESRKVLFDMPQS